MIYLFTYLVILTSNHINGFAQVKSENITISNGTIQLPGTLTYVKEKSPLVIWVHGSGNVDRNGNQKPMVKAIYIKQFRDEINKKETGEIAAVNPFLLSLFAKPNQPFLASWAKLNPIEEIKKVTIPSLIINGDKDIQVSIENAKNLQEAKPNASLVIVKNMNHILKDIRKDEDNLKSYSVPDFNISKQLVETISIFINKTQ